MVAAAYLYRASGVQFSGKEISEKRNGAERLRERIAGCAAFNNHGAGAQVLIKALLAQVDGAHKAWISCIKFGFTRKSVLPAPLPPMTR